MESVPKYSLRPKISVVCAFQEITLTKYIVKNINIYSTQLVSLKRSLSLVFYQIYLEAQILHIFSTNRVKLVA